MIIFLWWWSINRDWIVEKLWTAWGMQYDAKQWYCDV